MGMQNALVHLQHKRSQLQLETSFPQKLKQHPPSRAALFAPPSGAPVTHQSTGQSWKKPVSVTVFEEASHPAISMESSGFAMGKDVELLEMQLLEKRSIELALSQTHGIMVLIIIKVCGSNSLLASIASPRQ